MDGQPGDCHWPGLLDADVLDGCGPWHFTVSDDGAEVVAEVGDGLLHLGVERRCQIVFAQTVARLPPADAFPEGAAIFFEYRARGEPGGGQATPNSVSIGSGHGGLPARAEPAQHRLCARLGPYPRLVDLTLAIENFGSCDEETPAEIWVSNLRLEADEGCL